MARGNRLYGLGNRRYGWDSTRYDWGTKLYRPDTNLYGVRNRPAFQDMRCSYRSMTAKLVNRRHCLRHGMRSKGVTSAPPSPDQRSDGDQSEFQIDPPSLTAVWLKTFETGLPAAM